MERALMLAALCGLTIAPNAALCHEPAKLARDMQASSCPSATGASLTGVDIYDGPIADQAMLRPDDRDPRGGPWPLAYVYAAGRTVTLRRRYHDGTVVDRELRDPVRAFRYTIGRSPVMIVSCR